MKVYRGIWQIYEYMMVYDCISRYMKVCKVKVYGCIRKYIRVYASIWKYIQVYEGIWKYVKLYKGMVVATERRENTRIRGPQRKNRAQIKSGAVIWALSFHQKPQ